jgi:tetratricopeptide (TPR) repeat protein
MMQSLVLMSKNCRCFPARQVSVELAVEDTLGTAFILAIDNYPGLFQANVKVLDDQFPCGIVIAIREPWMKLSMSEYWAFVRVDSPSDILILGESDPLGEPIIWATARTWPEGPSTMTEWKERGKDYYNRNSFLPAAQAWTRALELDPTNPDLLLNRSMAYQRLEWHGAAHSDALRALAVNHSEINNNKAEYRAASAEYMMGKYTSALERFVRLARAGENVSNWQSRCKARMVEAKGKYNWKVIYNTGLSQRQHLDVSDFLGPIEVASMPHRGGGRGFRASRDIKAGELLVCISFNIEVE